MSDDFSLAVSRTWNTTSGPAAFPCSLVCWKLRRNDPTGADEEGTLVTPRVAAVDDNDDVADDDDADVVDDNNVDDDDDDDDNDGSAVVVVVAAVGGNAVDDNRAVEAPAVAGPNPLSPPKDEACESSDDDDTAGDSSDDANECEEGAVTKSTELS